MKTDFTDVSQLARGLVMNNYNSFFYGIPNLESALSHNVNLSYFSFNMFNYTNVFANINYNKSINNIRNQSDFIPGVTVNTNTPFNSSFADESISASGRIQRTFGKLRATGSGNLSYSKYNNFQNAIRSVSENYTQTYRAQLRTNFKTAPNVEVSYRHTIQDADFNSNKTQSVTKAPSVNFDALIWKTVTFKTDYTYNDFSNDTGNKNTYEFWNASLAYRKNQDSKWEFELKATNLLDTRSQTNTNTSDFTTSVTQYYIQPRYLTARIIYSL